MVDNISVLNNTITGWRRQADVEPNSAPSTALTRAPARLERWLVIESDPILPYRQQVEQLSDGGDGHMLGPDHRQITVLLRRRVLQHGGPAREELTDDLRGRQPVAPAERAYPHHAGRGHEQLLADQNNQRSRRGDQIWRT
jgi:hypothetical protein